MKKVIYSFIFIAFALSLSFCKKNKTEESEDFYIVTTDESFSNNLFDDCDQQIDEYANGVNNAKGACSPIVTISQNGFPKTVTIEYGQDGCQGLLGHIRKGKIVVTQTAPMTDKDAVRTINLINYSVDGFIIEGTRTVASNGINANGNYERTSVVANGKITTPDGLVLTRNSTRVLEWIEGSRTPYNVFDDKWKVTGTASGTNRYGKNYESVITNPLVFYMGCRYLITTGLITITTNAHLITIDYGTGDCDNVANISIDGVQETITF